MPAAAEDIARELERYLRHLAIERGRSAHTVAAYRRDVSRFADHVTAAGVGAVGEITRDHVEDFARTLREGPGALAPSSVARMLSSVRGFTRFLHEEGRIAADPGAQVRAPKLLARLPKALTVEQVMRVLDAAGGDDPAEVRDRALLELLYATGARISEAVALDVDDVTGEQGVTDVLRLFGKGGKQRIVPLGSFARSAIDAYLVRARPVLAQRGRATPALFLGARGGRLTRQNAWLRVRAAAERAKLEVELSPHSFRHSFATHLLQGGADVRVVQELLGHASVATTQIYTRVTADALREVYALAHPRAR